MGARLRRSGKAGFVTLLVVFALVGSGILAYAASAPSNGAYPSTADRVKGHGYCGTSFARTRFNFDIRTDRNKKVVGHFTTEMGFATPLRFFGNRGQTLYISGTSGEFKIVGEARGPGAGSGSTYTATVKFSGQIGEAHSSKPSTIDIKIANSSKTIYANACTVRGGRIVIPKNAIG